MVLKSRGVIIAFNELTEFIKKAQGKHNLSRDQVRYILTDKLNDMSKTDIYVEKRDEST